MRLKSELWVQAYIRTCQSHAVPAMLVRRGDADAGAIYIKIARLDGTALLFGPAPAGRDDIGAGRAFAPLHAGGTIAEAEAEAMLERHRRFDPDLWIVEVEDAAGRHFLDDWT